MMHFLDPMSVRNVPLKIYGDTQTVKGNREGLILCVHLEEVCSDFQLRL